MEKLLVLIEKTGTGYSAFIPGLTGIASVGDTLNEIRENIREALGLYVETSQEYGDPVPEILKGDYSLVFKFDFQSFLQWMSSVMSQRGLAEIASMNESLISQYASGIKKPGPKQLHRLQTAIHRFADDLHSISF
jgi:predicted RNase H-like HicB family nuclease